MDGGAVWPSHSTAAQRHSQYMSLRKQIQSNSSHIDFYRILSCTILILEDITDIAHGFFIYFLNDIPLIPKRLLQGLCLFWKNPMENRVVNGWLVIYRKAWESEVQTHSCAPRREKYWPIVAAEVSLCGFQVNFHCWGLLCMSWFATFCNACKKGRNARYWVYWLLRWNAMKCLVSLCKTLVWITIDPFWSYLLV